MKKTIPTKTKVLSWPELIKRVSQMTQNDLRPYVTRLAEQTYPTLEQKAFAVLIATIISLRTRDNTTELASEKLLKIAPTPAQIATLSEEQIAQTIYPCGFYKTKAEQIKQLAITLIKNHHGFLPRSLEGLLSLAGVGRKTANLVLTEGFDLPGICVDTHVHRILNRLGLVKTDHADETEMILREILPQRYWKNLNLLLVMFGQFHCKPIGPKCSECALSEKCDFFTKNRQRKNTARHL